MVKEDPKSLSADFWIGAAMPAILPLILVPPLLLRAWVLTVLWAWYVAPIFGVPPVRVAVAFGLCLIVGHFMPARKDDRKWGQVLSAAFVGPLITLGLGWLGAFFL